MPVTVTVPARRFKPCQCAIRWPWRRAAESAGVKFRVTARPKRETGPLATTRNGIDPDFELVRLGPAAPAAKVEPALGGHNILAG